jgi:hypothetical protein
VPGATVPDGGLRQPSFGRVPPFVFCAGYVADSSKVQPTFAKLPFCHGNRDDLKYKPGTAASCDLLLTAECCRLATTCHKKIDQPHLPLSRVDA